MPVIVSFKYRDLEQRGRQDVQLGVTIQILVDRATNRTGRNTTFKQELLEDTLPDIRAGEILELGTWTTAYTFKQASRPGQPLMFESDFVAFTKDEISFLFQELRNIVGVDDVLISV